MRSMRLFAILLLAVGLLAAVGCGRKKKAQTAPDAVAPAAYEAPAPAPAPAPEPAVPATDPDPLSGDLDSVNEYLRRQGLLGDVYFDYDRAELSSETRDRLARNARFLTDHPRFRLTVEGHCDERGTSEYNLALGERRAAAVRQYLSSLGISPDRLTTISYGKERPVCTEESESCWRLNRRAHHLVTGRAGG
jgi:peptidoglycan-associated lipoprotein